MPSILEHTIDPDLDLVLDRVIDVPRAAVWRAWTEPQLLCQWFCPAPWKVVEARVDLRAGGQFFTVMESPEGQRFPGDGCFLEVVEGERLTWTNALLPGFRPAPAPVDQPSTVDFAFTGVLTFTDVPGGTRYHALAKHRSRAERDTHAEMGFEAGWGAALDQLVALLRTEHR
jgi:uncharacterized protein YndB with AHSA1/START domain